jgi:putative glutamine amidotransferase
MQEIVLGFTTKPGLFYRRSFKEAAKAVGLQVKFCDLSGIDNVRWEKLDAVILPGGPDIDPCYYMNIVDDSLRDHTKRNRNLCHKTKAGRKRDAFEHGLLMELFHNRALSHLPVLGIGRGMQMLAVAQGIPLYLDLRLETGFISSRFEFVPVNAVPGTLFQTIVGKNSFRVFKNQHQAIRMPYLLGHKERWSHVRVSALSHDQSLAEAIEFVDRPVIGVQFHPEIALDPGAKNIFSWLVKEAQRRSEERKLILEQEHVY